MGSKPPAKQLALAREVPTVPGTSEPIRIPEEAASAVAKMGLSRPDEGHRGGGGKGHAACPKRRGVCFAWRDAAPPKELKPFGRPARVPRKYLVGPRHNRNSDSCRRHGVSQDWRRECSGKRRHQKVVEEEAPSTVVVTPELRPTKWVTPPCASARGGGYAIRQWNFVDANLNFDSLRSNTRLQGGRIPSTEQVNGLYS